MAGALPPPRVGLAAGKKGGGRGRTTGRPAAGSFLLFFATLLTARHHDLTPAMVGWYHYYQKP